MFRIDRSLVNLAFERSVRIDNEIAIADAAVDEPDEPIIQDASASSEIAAEIIAAEEIVHNAEIEAKEISRQIIREARDEATEILVKADEELETMRKEAWEQGYQEGSQEAARGFEKKAAEDETMLKRVIGELHDGLKRACDGLEDEVLRLSLGIVGKIMGQAGESPDGIFEPLIKNALRQMKLPEKIIIRVNQEEYERFFPSGNACFELEGGTAVSASVLKDAYLTPGSCIIDTEEETTNAGLESQLRLIELAFKDADYE